MLHHYTGGRRLDKELGGGKQGGLNMQRTARGRTVVFGLDGVDLGVVETWAKQGDLPFLNGCLSSGHLVKTCDVSLPGSQWVNFATGVSPARHGYVHTAQLKPGSYEVVATGARDVRVTPFYEFLDDAGLRCAIIDLPGDYPVASFKRGLQVIDWATEFKLWRYDTRPRKLRHELLSEIGEHPLTRYGHTIPDHRTLTALRAKLERGARMKGELARRVLGEGDWDFVFVGFGEGHKAGHFFWKFCDERHPDYDASDPYLHHALREIYRQLDVEMAGIAALLGEHDNMIVVSDRGMQSDLRGDHLMGAVLQRLGLYAPRSRSGDARQARDAVEHDETVRPATPGFRQRLGSALPAGVKSALRKLLGAERADWQRTRAFPLPNVGNSYIRINLKGREPLGTVSPGAEYEALLDRLERELYALVNPASGAGAVEAVSFPQRLFAGDGKEALPDISVLWRSDRRIATLTSPSFGSVQGRGPLQRSGNHNGVGFALAVGPAFQSGPSSRDGDLRQFAPTVFRIFGIAAPPHFELAPWTEILAPESRRPAVA